jgi:hypothetical protein
MWGATLRKLGLFASAAGLMLATGGAASAQPPITGGDSSSFSEGFTDKLSDCSDEVYDISVEGRAWFHYTYFEDSGALFFHERDHATIVGVPHDGSGVTYEGHFRDSDQESIRAVRGGDMLVEQDTDLHGGSMRGSDGSRIFMRMHAHFTVNANGEMTVQFDTFRFTCP